VTHPLVRHPFPRLVHQLLHLLERYLGVKLLEHIIPQRQAVHDRRLDLRELDIADLAWKLADADLRGRKGLGTYEFL